MCYRRLAAARRTHGAGAVHTGRGSASTLILSLTPLPRLAADSHPLSDALAVEVHDVAWQGVGAQYLVATPPAAAHGKFAAVPAGGNVTHIYSLIPKAPGYVLGMPASATYRASVDAEARQTVASTGVQVQVISRTSALADKAVMWGTYASLGFLRTREAWRNAALLSAAFGLFLGGTSAKRSVSAAMKRRTARQAEAALLKAE